MVSATDWRTGSSTREDAALRLLLLGGFRIEREGIPLPDAAWKRPQARTLIKLLATDPSHRLHREQIAEIFWPDAGPAAMAGNLRQLLYLVRQAAQADPQTCPVIVVRDELVILDSEHTWIDADAFERAARAARQHRSIQEMEAALALYGGELLPEDRYEEWVAGRREELAALHHELLFTLARHLLAAGDREAAAGHLQQLLALDPTHEAAHREVMRLHAAAGRRREALRQYELCRKELADQLGVEPDDKTEELLRHLQAGTLAPAPPPPPALLRPWSTPLVGRERALELVLADPLMHASPGEAMGEERPAVVLIGGEAGVGKTRLAAEAGKEAAGRGALVLWGTCYGRVAYGAFIEALEQYTANLSGRERGDLARKHPDLARILPSLEDPDANHDGGAGDQVALFAAVARLLGQLAATRPVLLVVDDLHQATDSTLALLSYLAHLPPARRNWTILATFRSDEVPAGSPVQTALATLQRSGRCRDVDLLPLGRRESERLAESMLGAPVETGTLAHLFRTSLGNPLFLAELIGALRSSGDLVPVDGSWSLTPQARERPVPVVPGQVAGMIAARLRTLEDGTRRLLMLAAVAGMTVPFRLLQRGAERLGQGMEEILDALERSVDARVLLERENVYSFQHPLFREVLYDQLGPARRVHLHGIVARALEEVQPGEAEALAYHWAHSGNREKTIMYLEQAGDHARSVYAHTQAETYYAELLGLLTPGTDAAQFARIQARLGAVLIALARHDEALTVLEEAAAGLVRVGDLDGHGRAVAAIGQTYYMTGRAHEVVDRLERTIGALEGQVGPLVLSDLRDALARCLIALDRHGDSAAVSERTIEQLRELVDDPARQWHLARAELQRATAAYFFRPLAEAQAILLAVMPVIESSRDPDLRTHAYNLAAYGALTAGDPLGSCEYYRRALETAEQMGHPGRAGRFRCLLGRSHFFAGEGEKGLRIAEEGYGQLAALGPSLYLAFGSHMLGVIYLGMGRWAEARRVFEAVSSIAGDNLEAARLGAYRAAELDLFEGNPERARERLEPLLSADAVSYDALLVCAHLAWACAALGDAEQALALAGRAVETSHVSESRLFMLEALYARAATLIELEQWDAAAQALADALALVRASGYVWHEAVILLMQARFHYRRRETRAAQALFRQGRDLLHHYGGEQAAARAAAYAGMPSGRSDEDECRCTPL